MSFLDIITNVVSDFIFVLLVTIALLVWGLLSRYARIGKAQQFFGFQLQTQIKIYVSGFEHSGVKTRRVVTALEYETVVEMRETLQQLPGRGSIHRIVDYLAGVIGQTIRYPEPDIEVSPLGEVKEPPYTGSTILIGGPVANQLTKFYLQDSPKFRFNESAGKYQRRDGEGYRDIESSNDVAVIEKKIVGEQVVILVHGFGEEQTRRAVRHLINNWERLYKQHGTQEFGVCV
jgi:hypothetical protein